jgi:hypothetical protein
MYFGGLMKNEINTAPASTPVEGQLESNYPFQGVSLTDAQVDSSIETIKELKAILPPMPGLTPQERQRLSKLGQKSRGFADLAIEAAKKDPGLLPGGISLAALVQQDELHRQISLVETHVSDLLARLEDALLLIGNHVFGSCRAVYTVLDKTVVGKAKMPGQKALLKQRFAIKKANRPGTSNTNGQ